jgi:nitrogen PTS system EIIA component
MDILGIVRRKCVSAGRSPTDKSSALQMVASLAAASGLLGGAGEKDVREALEHREAVGTTGFGKGIAIPHCRLESIEEFLVGIASVPAGVEFDSLDGEPVRLIVFIVGPASDSTEHIQILSAISRVLSNRDAVKEMVAAPSDESLYESFVRHLSDEPRPSKGEPRILFHVFVQDEEVFHEILQVFGGTEPRFTAVLDARNARSYLWKVPLFAGLWRDAPESFSRIIISLVTKKMTNEMIRRLESIVGPLSSAKNVLVVVQDTFFAGGSLGE